MKHAADGLFHVTPQMISNNACQGAAISFRDQFSNGRNNQQKIPVTLDFLLEANRRVAGASLSWMYGRVDHFSTMEQDNRFYDTDDEVEQATIIMDTLLDYARKRGIGGLKPLPMNEYEVSFKPERVEAVSAVEAAREYAGDNNFDLDEVLVRRLGKNGRVLSTETIYVDL
jgi:hypothetical protein